MKLKRLPSFDQWMRRPVYLAHCNTAAVAHTLPLDWTLLRILRTHRTPAAQTVRDAAAAAVRAYRQARKPWPPRVGPHATHCDLRVFCNITGLHLQTP